MGHNIVFWENGILCYKIRQGSYTVFIPIMESALIVEHPLLWSWW